MKLWDCTTENGKKALVEIYKQLTGRKLRLPGREKDIVWEVKLESPEEIDKIMRQKPNYAIDKQGREG